MIQQVPEKITDEGYISIHIAIMKKGGMNASLQKDTENW